jgi:glycerol kinase
MTHAKQILDTLTMHSELLEDIKSNVASVKTDVAGVLPHTVPLVGVIGDSQASLFAQRCFAAGTSKATFGTGTSILFNAGHERPTTTGTAATALAWVLHGRPTYALEGMINSALLSLPAVRLVTGIQRMYVRRALLRLRGVVDQIFALRMLCTVWAAARRAGVFT